MLKQSLAAAFLDMDYHTLKQINDLDIHSFEQASMDKIALIPEIKPRYRSTYFNLYFQVDMRDITAIYGVKC